MTPELVKGRHRARMLATKYNKYFPEDSTPDSLTADRMVLLKEMLGAVGEDSYIEAPMYIDYGCNIRIGERFYANFKYVLSCFLS